MRSPIRHTLAFTVLITLLVASPACRQPPPETSPSDDLDPTVVLISIDGFRWDYLDRHEAPHLSRLAAAGVRAKRLIPAFPTKTFPNHYTIVTGLYPEHHGIIANNMYDPAFDASFSLSNQDAITDERWWGGEPLWVTAEQQDQKAATYFWPGSEAAIQGIRPSYWTRYDGRVPGEERVDQVLAWLDLPKAERPTFITLYFSEVDHEGHDYGPTSDAVAEAVTHVDEHVGRLIDGLEQRSLLDKVNLVVVSDHGMVATSPDRTILLDDYIDLDEVQIVDLSPVLMLIPDEGRDDAVYEALSAAPHLHTYRKDAIPDTLHFRDHRRIPPIVAIADEGWSITRRDTYEQHPERLSGGSHGYVPQTRSMHALFVAHGPAFREGATVEPFANIHLYNLMAAILKLDPAPNDGDLDMIRHLLRSDAVLAVSATP